MKTRISAAVVFVLVGLAGLAVAQGPTVKNYFEQCGGPLCDNVFNIGGTWRIGGTAVTATAAQLNAAGAGAATKVASGTVTLDGSNPSSAATGLAAITACAVTNKRSTTPGLDPHLFTVVTSAVAGRIDVYAWKPTASTDVTMVASTDADDTIDWVCVGS